MFGTASFTKSAFYISYSIFKTKEMKQTLFLLLLALQFGEVLAQRPMVKNQQQPGKGAQDIDFLPQHLTDRKCNPPLDSGETYLGNAQTYLLRMPYVIDMNDPKRDRLISDYSFRKLIQSDFTKTVLGMDNISKINRYASLDLSDKPAFDFTPLAFNDDPTKKVFRNIFSVNISGKLNENDFFELKNLRDLTLKLNYVYIFNASNYKPNAKISTLRDPLRCDIKADVLALCEKYEQKIKDLCSGNCVSADKIDQERRKLVKAFIDEYSDIESSAAEAYWKSKNYYWLSINAGLKRDEFQYTSQDLLDEGKYTPKKETTVMPEVTAAFNGFHLYASGASLLYTLWGGVKRRHSLSEVYTPDNFQNYDSINGSVLKLNNNESVFVTDFTEIDRGFKADLGTRVVVLSPYLSQERKQQFGFSFSLSRRGLVSTESGASLVRTEAGLVFPFLTEDGTSKFNLEFFRRWDNFHNFPNENDKTWGFRFNIPISN
jgi:hypothetical protein